MKRFLKQNWFKAGLLAIGVVFIIFNGLNLYVTLKSHNLEVIGQRIACFHSFDNEEVRDACNKRVSSFMVSPSFFWKQLED